MRKIFLRALICTLILFLGAVQATALDLQVGPMNFSPAPYDHPVAYPADVDAFGATLTIPFGSRDKACRNVTLNGRNLSHFTRQDAKDTAIVLMLISVSIGLYLLTASTVSVNSE